MAIDAKIQIKPVITETLGTGVAGASDKVIVHDLYKVDTTIKAGSTVPATKCAVFSQALSSGTASINLAALTGTNGAAVDFTGLKLQYLQISSATANGTLEVDVGSSNGYNLGNNAATEFHIGGGDTVAFYYTETNPDVASGARVIDLVGTGTETFDVVLIAG